MSQPAQRIEQAASRSAAPIAAGVTADDAALAPDHPSGAVRLAADDSGAPTALDIRTDLLPADFSEIVLTIHTTADRQLHLDATDAEHGPIGRLLLPPPEPGGLIQIGALHRSNDQARWHLLIQPDAPLRDLAGLATAAAIDIA